MSNQIETANTARDGNVAIHEEFDAALKLGNTQAIQMFIQRHPNHPLAETAREHLNNFSRPKKGN